MTLNIQNTTSLSELKSYRKLSYGLGFKLYDSIGVMRPVVSF
jgi:hypothetical protein